MRRKKVLKRPAAKHVQAVALVPEEPKVYTLVYAGNSMAFRIKTFRSRLILTMFISSNQLRRNEYAVFTDGKLSVFDQAYMDKPSTATAAEDAATTLREPPVLAEDEATLTEMSPAYDTSISLEDAETLLGYKLNQEDE